ncbi:MAG TPA: restriction endonuclease [Candidatus Dormibacteraeota bacterium]|nr:restriction endonuclease [Candidatus Dormibacteraeota bacterium]
MARSSYNHHYHHSSNDEMGFILTILVGVATYRYWQDSIGLEHQALKMLPTIGAVVVATVLLVLLVKFKLHHRSVKLNRSMAEIDNMSGLDFEKYVAALLKQQGYRKVKLTEKFDYGVDIIADKDGIRWGIQVKRYSGLVKAEAVRQVVTALKFYGCDRAMVVTNSTFSKQAKILAKSNDCVLLDRRYL